MFQNGYWVRIGENILGFSNKCACKKKWKDARASGIEPGSTARKTAIATSRPQDLGEMREKYLELNYSWV